MITEQELNDADVDKLLTTLAGAGSNDMMTMVISARSSVTAKVTVSCT